MDSKEFTTLKSLANEPTADHIISKSNAVGLVCLTVLDHKELSDFFHRPTKLQLEVKAKEIGLIILEAKEYNDMVEQLKKPSLDYLKQKLPKMD